MKFDLTIFKTSLNQLKSCHMCILVTSLMISIKTNHYNIGFREDSTELLRLYLTMICKKDWILLENNNLDDIIDKKPAVLS